MIENLRSYYQFCADPIAIQCTANDGSDESHQNAKENDLVCDLNKGGFYCINSRQNGAECRDFKVRVNCDCGE